MMNGILFHRHHTWHRIKYSILYRTLCSSTNVSPKATTIRSQVRISNQLSSQPSTFSGDAYVNTTSSLVVSILGPPNAGKSTLFNRLLCKHSNKAYRLSSEKEIRRPQRSRGRLGYKDQSSKRPRWGAIISSTPGTTRDRRECIGRIGDITFTLVDTAGVDADRIHLLNSHNKQYIAQTHMEKGMMEQTLEAAKMSDVIFVLFDGRVGITSDIEEIARWLRKLGCTPYQGNEMNKPCHEIQDEDENKGLLEQHTTHKSSLDRKRTVVLLANKLEGDSWNNANLVDGLSSTVLDHLHSSMRLGFGPALPISAEHGEGIADIAVIIQKLHDLKQEQNSNHKTMTQKNLPTQLDASTQMKPLQMAIVGRQNVGKSTLINALVQKNRVITGPTPGLTRDAIAISWSWKGQPVQLIDTAGIRRIAQRDHSDRIEDMAVHEATRALKIAQVVVLLLDAEAKFLSRQELAIADAVVREGRALVVVANKMDLVLGDDYERNEFVGAVRKQLEQRYPMLRKTPVLAISALNNSGVDDLMPVVFAARDRWSKVIGTGLLNRWLSDVLQSKSPPLSENKRKINIKYIMQTKGRPPTFLLFCNVKVLPMSYVRYLIRNFQDTFEMYGMDVRMAVKESSTENPFTRNKNKKIGIGGTRIGIGGARNRKKRFVEVLKSTGSKPKKSVSRRHFRSQYRYK